MGSMFNLGWIPVFFVLSTVLAYFVPYFVAIYTGHVYPFFPAISDSGILVPESLVFRELMNISGFLAITTILIRFWQVRLVISSIERSVPKQMGKINCASMNVGIIGGFSVTFVGNFSAKKEHAFSQMSEYSVHNVAAVVVFSTGLLYCGMHSYISFRMRRYGVNTIRMCLVRTIITLSVICNFMLFIGFSRWADYKYNTFNSGHDHLKNLGWRPGQDGYVQHLVSSISEWIMCLSMVGYTLTFVKEFNYIRITTDFSDEYSIDDFIVSEAQTDVNTR